VHQYKKNATGTESRIDGKEINKSWSFQPPSIGASHDWNLSGLFRPGCDCGL
jgi:hypothetical protein